MTATLQDILLSQQNFPNVVADAKALVDQELDAKGGISGTTVKVAYKAVTSFAPGYYQQMIEVMVPSLAERLAPFWADFAASGSGSFGDYLSKRGDEVSEALLSITDQMAADSDKGAIIAAYKAVRGGASKNIEAALPNLGVLVQKYAA
jgi:hypothetical protein